MICRLREWRINRMTDRVARRPQGRAAREVYGADDVHSFAWEPVLAALQLTNADVLLDVGCGGAVYTTAPAMKGTPAARIRSQRAATSMRTASSKRSLRRQGSPRRAPHARTRAPSCSWPGVERPNVESRLVAILDRAIVRLLPAV